MEKYNISTPAGLMVAEDALKYQIEYVLNGIGGFEYDNPKPETLIAMKLLVDKIDTDNIIVREEWLERNGVDYSNLCVVFNEVLVGESEYICKLFDINKMLLESVRRKQLILEFEREKQSLLSWRNELVAETTTNIDDEVIDTDNFPTKLALTRDQVCLLFNLLMANNCIKRQTFEDLAVVVSKLTGFSEGKIRQNLESV